MKGKPELLELLNAEELKAALKKADVLQSQVEVLKRENFHVQQEKNLVMQDYNVEYKKKVYLLDITKRLIEKIEKPIQRILEENLAKVDFREDFEKEYKFIITFLEAQRVGPLD